MFKTLENNWNAHTPVWLHNGTKENLIFQISATVVFCGTMIAYNEFKTRREIRNIEAAINEEK